MQIGCIDKNSKFIKSKKKDINSFSDCRQTLRKNLGVCLQSEKRSLI